MTNAVEQAGTVCGEGPTVKGIDVSYYEGSIDWSAVAGDGVQFAFVRVSDGLAVIDPKFDAYWKGSRAAGIVHGAYQFFRPAQDPIAQADLLLQTMGPMQPGDLPPVIDVEVNGGLSSTKVAAAVKLWVDHVQAAIGRAPIIYTGKYFWDDNVGADSMGSLPLWHAQYTSAACPDISTTWTSWHFWQYTSTGTIAGIPGGGVDVNRWNGDRASLDAFLGGPDAKPCMPLPAAGGVVDDGDACFSSGGPSQYMREVATAGEDGDLLWTHATYDAAEANYADWQLAVAAPGRYEVEVYTAAPWATSKRADYQVTASGQMTSVTIDQTAVDGWQSLGAFDFTAGSGEGVHLGDNTGEDLAANVQLVFDAVRITALEAGSDMMGSDRSNPGTTGSAGTGCAAAGSTGGGLALGLLALVRRRKRARSA